MSIKFKFIHKEKPSNVPGTWEDSKLIFKIKGPKHDITEVAKAIKAALAELKKENIKSEKEEKNV